MTDSDRLSVENLERTTAVRYLKNVGPARARIFHRLGIKTVADLLEYYPRDYHFIPAPIEIARLEPDRQATVIGQVTSIEYRQYSNPPRLEVMIADRTGLCRIVWFHGGYLRDKIKLGQFIIASAKVSRYKHQLQLVNPAFAIIDENQAEPYEHLGGAVYRASASLSSSLIKKIIRPVLDNIPQLVEEFFDKRFRDENNLIERQKAFLWIHRPEDEQTLAKARRRLKFDELFLMQLGLAIRKFRVQHYCKAIAMKHTELIDKRIRKRFPFLLTPDQDRVIAEIVSDMGRDVPMNRLLQGDVGSGKTVVALYAALLAVANRTQVAIMAPTEILASQHFTNIERYLKNSRVRRTLLTGGLTGRRRTELIDKIASGQMDIVVGTVALLQKDVTFKSLALVIIDEQHKFGVHQRAQLRKDLSPHCLVMTATPIPRTLAMTVFGDLDVSVIKNSPPGRGQVITRWVDAKDRDRAYEFIRDQLRKGRQAYFVYPRITGQSENGSVAAATEGWKLLSQKVFPEFKIGLLHGQMPTEQKQKIMSDFRRARIDILVSTVVIEVGIDVPNATVMVIETADRFGLAQLHQLRGRIGRGQEKSYCLLFAEATTASAKSRLEVMTRCNDGFEIAEHDLRLRGPGELFSTRQHGLPDLEIANIIDDYDLLLLARRKAFELVEKDPSLSQPGHSAIRRALIEKFGSSIVLADVA